MSPSEEIPTPSSSSNESEAPSTKEKNEESMEVKDEKKSPDETKSVDKEEAGKRNSVEVDAASALASLTSRMTPPVEESEQDQSPKKSPGKPGDDASEDEPSDAERETSSIGKSKNAREKAIRFPVKLMAILSSDEYEDIISWTPDGESFVVKKPSALVSKVLPFHFKEVKYSSFTRKLHRWGFTKLLRGRDMSAYSHKKFKRGKLELCQEMRCCNKPISHQPMHMPGNHLLQPRPAPPVSMAAAAISSRIEQEMPHHILDYEAAALNRYAQHELQSRMNPRHQAAFAQGAALNHFGSPYDSVRGAPPDALYSPPLPPGVGRYPRLSTAAAGNAALARAPPSSYPLNIGLASSNHNRIIENAWNALARELRPTRKPAVTNEMLLRNELLNRHHAQQLRNNPAAGQAFGPR